MVGLSHQGFAHGPDNHEEEAVTAVGAPAEGAEAGHASASSDEEPGVEVDSVDADAYRSISFWKNLHPATVHFPIALFLVAGMVEALSLRGGGVRKQAAVDVMVVAGAIGGVVAVTTGWLHTGWWLGGEAVMQWHRWTGMGLAAIGMIAAVLVLRGARRSLLRLCLALLVVGVAVQGYLGGELSHGPAHLGF